MDTRKSIFPVQVLIILLLIAAPLKSSGFVFDMKRAEGTLK